MPTVLDRELPGLVVDGVPVVLSPLEFRCVRRLIEARGGIIGAEALIASLWPASPPKDAGRRLRDVFRHLHRLLSATGASGLLRKYGGGYAIDLSQPPSSCPVDLSEPWPLRQRPPATPWMGVRHVSPKRRNANAASTAL